MALLGKKGRGRLREVGSQDGGQFLLAELEAVKGCGAGGVIGLERIVPVTSVSMSHSHAQSVRPGGNQSSP